MKLWADTETFSECELKTRGSFRYAEDESTEIMLFSYAIDDSPVDVVDFTNGEDLPLETQQALADPEVEVWFQNGFMFDWPVIGHVWPNVAELVKPERRRDTMIQAYSHGLPGGLDPMCVAMRIDARKTEGGRRLIHLFCKPQNDAFFKKHGTRRATRQTHPVEWHQFKEYAKGDIGAMRAAHRAMPMWNYRGFQLELSLLDQKINARGIRMDVELAEAAVRASGKALRELSVETARLTDDQVRSATQRDQMIKFILERHGVVLADMKAATLERLIGDPDLPDALRELLHIRLQSVTTSVSKFKTLLRATGADKRLRGTMQWRGASRTGRVAHRLFQTGNMPRPTMKQWEIEIAIDALKHDGAHIVFGNVMEACSNTIRSTIICDEGNKLVVADLSNIEGRFGAWLAGEEWKLQAFRDFDTIVGVGEDGKKIRGGTDLYILAYAKSFNVAPEDVPEKGPERQIGKVEELMFQYEGGVGAWITGAATYGIDLDQMTEQVWDVLPVWAKDEATSFLGWLYEGPDAARKSRLRKLAKRELIDTDEEIEAARLEIEAKLEAEKLKERYGLSEKTFVACDAIKRTWRRAHPAISSYWKEIKQKVAYAIQNPGETIQCRKVKIRRDGAWLRCVLPSGRALCYPSPKILPDGTITYMGLDQYTRQWKRQKSYGGKFFENWTQAGAADQLFECAPDIEEAGYPIVLSVHDEFVTEPPDDPGFTAADLSERMCKRLSWNEGLPLAAAGYEAYRYKKE